MSRQNAEVVREVYAEWARGEFVGALRLFDEDIAYTTFAAGEGDELVLNGLDAVVSWNRQFFSHWRNYRVEAHEVVDRGDTVLVIGHQYAEGKGQRRTDGHAPVCCVDLPRRPCGRVAVH
jgi:ketosteroid isomerase-like protein